MLNFLLPILLCCTGPNIVEEPIDLNAAVDSVLKATRTEAYSKTDEVDHIGRSAGAAVFALERIIGYLEYNEVDTSTLRPFREQLIQKLDTASPIFNEVIVTLEYARILTTSNAGKLRAAALYIEVQEKLSNVKVALEGTNKIIEEAREEAKKLMEDVKE